MMPDTGQHTVKEKTVKDYATQSAGLCETVTLRATWAKHHVWLRKQNGF